MNPSQEVIINFLKKLPPIIMIGVMGTCGKSTTFHLIESIFKESKDILDIDFVALDLSCPELFDEYLKNIKRDSIVLVKISDEILKIINLIGIIPTVSVITCIEEGVENYLNLIKKHIYTNYLVGTDEVVDTIKKNYENSIRGKIIRTGVNILPKGSKMSDFPYHFREDAALAVRVAEIFEIPQTRIIKAFSSFKGLNGRLEFLKKVKEVTYINDGYSQCFSSLKAALKFISKYKNTVLIMGGNDNFYSKKVIDDLIQYCHTFIMLPGSGSQILYKEIFKKDDLVCSYANSIEEAVIKASEKSRKGDIVLFSPGFLPTKWSGDREERTKKFSELVGTVPLFKKKGI